MNSWNSRPACADRLDLPWTTDRVDVTEWQAVSMAAVCQACPALSDCMAAVKALGVTGGWWAGADRDPLAVDPADRVPLTWRPLVAQSGHLVGAQAALDLDHLHDVSELAA